MGLADWLKGFRSLHERSKKGDLSDADQRAYVAARDELARALLAVQHISLQPGQLARRVLRIPHALQVELEFHDGTERAVTRDISSAGFGALLAKAPAVQDEVKAVLRVPGGEPVRGDARVVGVKRQVGNAYVCFEFRGLDGADAERLESFVFDAALDRILRL
jgi:hypothetical protein